MLTISSYDYYDYNLLLLKTKNVFILRFPNQQLQHQNIIGNIDHLDVVLKTYFGNKATLNYSVDINNFIKCNNTENKYFNSNLAFKTMNKITKYVIRPEITYYYNNDENLIFSLLDNSGFTTFFKQPSHDLYINTTINYFFTILHFVAAQINKKNLSPLNSSTDNSLKRYPTTNLFSNRKNAIFSEKDMKELANEIQQITNPYRCEFKK